MNPWFVFAALIAFGSQTWAEECRTPLSAFPKSDIPSAAQKVALKDCSAKAAYYGIGEPVDYTRARHCAFLEREKDGSLMFSSNSVLMMIYANGYEVRKDLELATRLAQCDVPGSRADRKKRIAHLASLKTKKESRGFDYCDDAATGMMKSLCAIHEEEIRQARKKR